MECNSLISERLREKKLFRRSNISKLKEVIIEVSFNCNLNCSFCLNKSVVDKSTLKEGMELSTERILAIIDKLAKLKIPFIRFSGGEPLLREDIFELLKHAKSKGFKEIRLNTNGLLVNEETSKKLERYVDNVLIGFNLPGVKENEDVFNKKIEALKLLKNTSIKTVRAGSVAIGDNIKRIDYLYGVVSKLELDDWEFYRPITKTKDEAGISVDELNMLLEKIEAIKKDSGKLYPIANAIPFCALGMEKADRMDKVCLGARYDDGHCRLVIDPRGYIKPSYFINKNLGNAEMIEEAWNSNFLNKMHSLDYLDEKCMGCEYLEGCKGGSRYCAMLGNGNYFTNDPMRGI